MIILVFSSQFDIETLQQPSCYIDYSLRLDSKNLSEANDSELLRTIESTFPAA